MGVFEKTADVIKKVYDETGLSELEIRSVVSRVVPGFHNPSREKKVDLVKTDVMVYECLLNNGFNPNTVYRWFLVTSAPKDVQRKLRSGEITIRQAKPRRENTKRHSKHNRCDRSNYKKKKQRNNKATNNNLDIYLIYC